MSDRAVAPMLGFCGLGMVPLAAVPAPTPLEVLLAEYRRYLEDQRGLAAGAVVHYLRYARVFLTWLPGSVEQSLPQLSAGQVIDFVRDWISRRRGTARAMLPGGTPRPGRSTYACLILLTGCWCDAVSTRAQWLKQEITDSTARLIAGHLHPGTERPTPLHDRRKPHKGWYDELSEAAAHRLYAREWVDALTRYCLAREDAGPIAAWTWQANAQPERAPRTGWRPPGSALMTRCASSTHVIRRVVA